MTKHARFFLLPSFILISAALIAGCNDKGEEKAHVGEPQVTVHIVEGANKWGNSSRLTQSFHFFMFEPIFSPVNALNQPI